MSEKGNKCLICERSLNVKEPRYNTYGVGKDNKGYWGAMCIPCYIKEHKDIMDKDEKKALMKYYNKIIKENKIFLENTIENKKTVAKIVTLIVIIFIIIGLLILFIFR